MSRCSALISAEKPFSIAEKQDYYIFEFRKLFGISGGRYIKTFSVHRAMGKFREDRGGLADNKSLKQTHYSHAA